MKKYLSLVLAAALVLGALFGCAGHGESPHPPPLQAPLSVRGAHSQAAFLFASEEYENLLALRFDGYEEMTVAEFRDKVLALTDTEEYRSLFERISSEDPLLQDLNDDEEAAEFLFSTLMPLTDDNWRTKSFNGAAAMGADSGAVFEYGYVLTITDGNALTVREYNAVQRGIADGLQAFFDCKSVAELQNEAAMKALIDNEIASLTELWESEKIKIELEYAFYCDTPLQDETQNSGSTPGSDTEVRRAEHGTKEDYQSLLVLKTPDYEDMSIADFNEKLAVWADEDFERMERVDADTLWNDFQVSLSEEELNFIRLTVLLSGRENGEHMRSIYTGTPAADPVYQESLPQKTCSSNGKSPMWCDFGYQFSYHISGRETLTVGERDRCVGGMLSAVQNLWDETPLAELLTMTESDILSQLTSLAAEYSSDAVTITVNTERVHFEHTELLATL